MCQKKLEIVSAITGYWLVGKRRWCKNWIFQNCLKISWTLIYIYTLIYIDISKSLPQTQGWEGRKLAMETSTARGRESKAELETSRGRALTFRAWTYIYIFYFLKQLAVAQPGICERLRGDARKMQIEIFRANSFKQPFSSANEKLQESSNAQGGCGMKRPCHPPFGMAKHRCPSAALMCQADTGSWEMSFLIPLRSGLGESFNSWKPVLSPAVLGIWPRGWYYSPQTRKLFFLLAQLPYLWFLSLGSPDAHLTTSQTENEWGSSVLNFNSADAFPADVLISSWISSPLVHGN